MTPNTYDQLQQLDEDFWTWPAANQPISSDDIPRIERSLLFSAFIIDQFMVQNAHR
jgi:hypothetical protein